MSDVPSDPAAPNDPTQTAHASAAPGASIGPYRLLEKLGEGGMGEVWLADQTSPVRRQVALKIIKAGMDSAQVVARFQAERQALALMVHPAIAAVFDAGTTTEGRPYFVMEYVKGEPITAYCDRHRLNNAERLALFIRVCEGVQHAHQKGIIHRDLKASNVLVTVQDDHPVPKIIDFGVAKATTRHLIEGTLFTEIGVLIGTPEYMSPEQADLTSLDIDTRTDVYSLGVLLYELLTGALPFDRRMLQQHALEEIRRTIREVDPPRPSTRVTQLGADSQEAARNRHTEPARLAGELRGDLDWITMKALEKDRTRRYATASEFAADISRHLDTQPVLAGPPSALYKARKFVRRHRFGVGAAAGLVFLLAVFGIVMAVQAQRIARERDRANREASAARQVSDFLVGLFSVSDPREARGNLITAREILDRGSRKIDSELRAEPLVRARLMHTMARVYDQLGLYTQALPLAESSLSGRRTGAGADQRELAESLTTLGTVKWHLGEYDASRALHEEALAIRHRLDPGGLTEADSLHNLGTLLYTRGQYAAAQRLLERALAIRERAAPGGADVASTLHSLGAIAYKTGQLAEAGRLWERALAIREKALGPDHPWVAQTLNNIAIVRIYTNNNKNARPLLERAIRIQEKVLGPKHPDLASPLMNLGDLVWFLGDANGAKRYYEQAVNILQESNPENPELAHAMDQLAGVTLEQGDSKTARGLYQRSLALREKVLGREHHANGDSLSGLAQCAHHDGDERRAQQLYERALVVYHKPDGGYYPLAADALEGYAAVLERLGERSRARELKDQAASLRKTAMQP
jgi:serine/threonine protein kinase/Tfp pilus assembly protein PilF